MDANQFKQWAKDAGERIASTTVQAAIAVTAVEVGSLPEWAAVPILAGLTWLKAQAARKLGDPGTAALRRG
ncbi:hypothetical protein [Jiangella muralis]|uniref:hypothetical protein n=1 Tax=Jiangella muralis TaxID=702383 RepID=UPI00069EB216|nr:hypothetical protein [Jiangella muralis]